ncbi:MAG: protein kinase [Egibacteraceae bacterium]
MSERADMLAKVWPRLGLLTPILALGLEPERELTARVGLAVKVRGRGGAYMLKAVACEPPVHGEGDDGRDERRAGSLLHEARVLQALKPCGVRLYVAHGHGASLVWLLTRWITGDDARARSRQLLGGAPPTRARQRFLDLCIAACARLEDLRRCGWLHGDQQPRHFLVDQHDRVHLVDYELAVRIDDPSPAYGGALVHYVSPETAREMLHESRTIPLELTSEIYSFGAVLFMLYAGAPPTDYGRAQTKQQRLAAIAAGNLKTLADAGAPPFGPFEAIVARCLRPEPADRWASLAELGAALAAARDQLRPSERGERRG